MATNEVKVDISAVLHTALKGFAEEFAKEHKVELSAVYFNWAHSGDTACVTCVEIHSKSFS